MLRFRGDYAKLDHRGNRLSLFPFQGDSPSLLIGGTLNPDDFSDRFSIGALQPGDRIVLDASAVPEWSPLRPKIELFKKNSRDPLPNEDGRDGVFITTIQTAGEYDFRVSSAVIRANRPEPHLKSQYVVDLNVSSVLPLTVSEVMGPPLHENSLGDWPHEFRLQFNKAIDTATLTDTRIELRASGPDDSFDTDDDFIYHLSTSWDASQQALLVHLLDGPVIVGPHRLNLSSDLAGFDR